MELWPFQEEKIGFVFDPGVKQWILKWCKFGDVHILTLLGLLTARNRWGQLFLAELWGVFYWIYWIFCYILKKFWLKVVVFRPYWLNFSVLHSLCSFLLVFSVWCSWRVSWHLRNTPRKLEEMETVLKMCEPFGSFIKEAHSFSSRPTPCRVPLIILFSAFVFLLFFLQISDFFTSYYKLAAHQN